MATPTTPQSTAVGVESPSPDPDVLIVDQSDDAIDVLQTVLARRGLRSIGTKIAKQGIAMAKQSEPRLIVVDIDSLHDDPLVIDGFTESDDQNRPRVVFLGNLRPSPTPTSRVQVVPKPYHYATLIRKIEDMLADAKAA